MKITFMLLTLFILAAPLHAASSDSRGKYQEIYPAYLSDPAGNRSQPEPDYYQDPYYLKLLQIIEYDQQVITIKANLSVQELMESTA